MLEKPFIDQYFLKSEDVKRPLSSIERWPFCVADDSRLPQAGVM